MIYSIQVRKIIASEDKQREENHSSPCSLIGAFSLTKHTIHQADSFNFLFEVHFGIDFG